MLNNQAGGPANIIRKCKIPITLLALMQSQIDCCGTLHLWCQLYDKVILRFKIIGFRIFLLGSGGGDAGRNFGWYMSTFRECSVFWDIQKSGKICDKRIFWKGKQQT